MKESGDSRRELVAHITRLRADLSETLARMDEIRQQVIPRIKADYATKIGVWNVRRVKAELAARRAKRRYAMARARVNRGESVEPEAITKALDAEFADWRRMMDEKMRTLNALLRWRSGRQRMTAGKAGELNRLFRRLARRFHPDLFPGDEQRAQYYEMACNALANGDLEMLRALDVATADWTDDVDYGRLTADELAGEIELLEDRLSSCRGDLNRMVSTEPYTLRAKLDDPEWVSGVVGGLRARVEAFEREKTHYDEAYDRLIKEDR
ncbi:DnaJ-like protein [Bifidobacterium stellenboschense]|uniref:DnaJ-like protein n=2 Tax=Bifidobacterium stellenboschense TaxID=762211 RepID=A0A087D979_9BIFI|nr:DnaJ-like protein [Bifidobacterium stellenboschense]